MQLRDATWVFTTLDQKIGGLDDGRIAVYHPVSGGEGGLWIYTQPWNRGVSGAQPQPLTTATSVLSDGAVREQGSPDCNRAPDTHWLGLFLLHISNAASSLHCQDFLFVQHTHYLFL